MSFALREYQAPHAVALLNALRKSGGALDASDTGTGKTPVALVIAKTLGVTPFVICPRSVRQDWIKAGEMVGIDLEVVGYEKVRGPSRPVLTSCPRCEENGKPFFGPFTIHLSRSEWGWEEAYGSGSRWQWAASYEMMIFDEVDRCGGNKTVQAKLLLAARRQSKYVLCLSATAADNPKQLRALGYAIRLFTLENWFAWVLRHGCRRAFHGGLEFTKDPAKQKAAMLQIHKEIFGQGRGSRMRKSEIPGFPQTTVDVKLIEDEDGKAKHLAQELADNYAESPKLAMIQAIRGALELIKVPHLAELAEHYAKTSRVVIFVNYRATIAALRRALSPVFGPVGAIDGDTTQKERWELRTAFQANKLPVILCNNQAGGIGIGMHDPTGQVERTTLISPCYSARLIKQVLGRTPRDGGAFSQQFLVYFADTLEAQVAAAVQNSIENLDALNDAILHGVNTHDAATEHHKYTSPNLAGQPGPGRPHCETATHHRQPVG